MDTVSAISDILTGQEIVETKYGIVLRKRDPVNAPGGLPMNYIKPGSRHCAILISDLLGGGNKMVPSQKAIQAGQKHMSIFQRCHFQLKAGPKLETLIARFIEHVDNLRKISSEA